MRKFHSIASMLLALLPFLCLTVHNAVPHWHGDVPALVCMQTTGHAPAFISAGHTPATTENCPICHWLASSAVCAFTAAQYTAAPIPVRKWIPCATYGAVTILALRSTRAPPHHSLFSTGACA